MPEYDYLVWYVTYDMIVYSLEVTASCAQEAVEECVQQVSDDILAVVRVAQIVVDWKYSPA